MAIPHARNWLRYLHARFFPQLCHKFWFPSVIVFNLIFWTIFFKIFLNFFGICSLSRQRESENSPNTGAMENLEGTIRDFFSPCSCPTRAAQGPIRQLVEDDAKRPHIRRTSNLRVNRDTFFYNKKILMVKIQAAIAGQQQLFESTSINKAKKLDLLQIENFEHYLEHCKRHSCWVSA